MLPLSRGNPDLMASYTHLSTVVWSQDNQIRVQAAEIVTDLPAYAAIKAAITGNITDFYVLSAAAQRSMLLSSPTGLTSSQIEAAREVSSSKAS